MATQFGSFTEAIQILTIMKNNYIELANVEYTTEPSAQAFDNACRAEISARVLANAIVALEVALNHEIKAFENYTEKVGKTIFVSDEQAELEEN